MAEIIMVVNSIDRLAPYKVSDDLILDLVNVTALVKIDLEDAAAATCWIEIIEPHNLAKHQPRGGYLLDNRQIQMTCAKGAGVSLGDEIRAKVIRPVNSRSQDISVNVRDRSETVFDAARQKLHEGIENQILLKELLTHLQVMEEAESHSIWAAAYSKFIEGVANHMTIIAPFLPALAETVSHL